MRGCQANENCFSTSATAGGKRVSPWLFKQSPSDAREVLTEAIKLEGLKILQSKAVGGAWAGEGVGVDKTDKIDSDGDKASTGERYYFLAAEKGVAKQPSGASVFFEFLIKVSLLISIGWLVMDNVTSDANPTLLTPTLYLQSGKPNVVLYRTVIDKTIFVYPLQQPVGDFGYLKSVRYSLYLSRIIYSYQKRTLKRSNFSGVHYTSIHTRIVYPSYPLS